MFKKIVLLAVVVFASASAGVVSALPAASAAVTEGQIFTVEWGGGLYTVDPATGATTLVGDTGVGAVTGVVWDASTSSLLAVNYEGACNLSRIDPVTAASETIGATGHDDCTGFDRDPTSGTLYMVYDIGGGSGLATIDESSGAATDVAPVTFESGPLRISALAAESDGTLLGFGYDDNMYSIDTATGEATLLHSGIVESSDVIGANFDCSGVLYGTDDYELFTIDVTTGATTDVGTMFPIDGEQFSEDLTVACGVVPPPEPPTPPTPPAPAAEVVATPHFTG